MLDDYNPESSFCQDFFQKFLKIFCFRYFSAFGSIINIVIYVFAEKTDLKIIAKNLKNLLTFANRFDIIPLAVADVAHLVERHLAKVEVASSSLVIRSILRW